MEIRRLRYAAAALCLGLATTAAALPFTRATAAAEQVEAGAQAPMALTTPSWTYATSVSARVDEAVADHEAALLQDAKLSLRAGVRAADELSAAAAGKASDAARQALAVERNRAMTAIKLSEVPSDVAALEPTLAAARDAVTAEVQAWEAAEAARIAEEARVAEEQRRAQESPARSKGSSGGGSGAAAASPASGGGDIRAYLEGIAGSYGATISWADAPCGRGGGARVSGCYAGGSTITVSNSALASWDTAKGKGRNVVLHEVSHMLIQWTCGTVLLGGERFENVTDAYAILLGAGGTTGYGYNDNDRALAEAAIGGQCLEG